MGQAEKLPYTECTDFLGIPARFVVLVFLCPLVCFQSRFANLGKRTFPVAWRTAKIDPQQTYAFPESCRSADR
jgi:hypothetical protein